MGRVSKDKACRDYFKQYKATCRKYRKRRNFFKILFGYCPWCGQWFRWSVSTKRRHTQYCDEAANWLTACRECQEEDDAYYDELWKDYYSSIY